MPLRQIYLLSPKELSPETIAVAFAKTSRSPESFREIAAGLTEETSAKFHEKWVVGYGHASVAEHAILHIAIENISRLAIECIESNRLASYTEKSSRYQKWDADNFFIPSELDERPLRAKYVQTCRLLFETYLQTIPPVKALVEASTPRKEKESDEAYDRRIRSQYVDSCRFLLPAASLANVGMTANARVLEHAIRKMLSHPLMEVRQIGEQVKEVTRAEVPTLVKYADALPYLIETRKDLLSSPLEEPGMHPREKTEWCVLVEHDPNGENKILAAALYRFGGMPYQEALDKVNQATFAEREALAEQLLGKLGEHDTPLRELEHTTYTFEVTLDQGGYAELKRHRMMTQTPQALTAGLGYAIPKRVVEVGLEAAYHTAMEAASETYEVLASWNPEAAAYVVPNGFNRRVLLTFNLREAFTFCQLRSAPNAHFSMRRVAERIAAVIGKVHPLLARHMNIPSETWEEVERKSFSQT